VQASALLELQKRFVKQQQELQAATAVAAGSNTSEGVQVEPYFPQDKLQQELATLRQVFDGNSAIAARRAICPCLMNSTGLCSTTLYAEVTQTSVPGHQR